MSGILWGRAAQISFAKVLTGAKALSFGTIPEGTYPVGHPAFSNNLVRSYSLEGPIEAQTTPFTQSQFRAVREEVGDQNRLVMALKPDHRAVLVARGRESAIGELSDADILGEIQRNRVLSGALLAKSEVGGFDRTDVPATLLRFSLEPEWEGKLEGRFLGDDYPAYASQWMAKAIAALSLEGYRLPGNEEWEVAAGDLKEEESFDSQRLTEVAVFGRSFEEGPTAVGTKASNKYSLGDMLGLVWEWGQVEGVLRGGSWVSNPEVVRTALVYDNYPPGCWGYYIGFRLFRPQDFPG